MNQPNPDETVLKTEQIFGTDGVRAVAGEFPLTREGVRQLGWCVGGILRKKVANGSTKILLGKDTRESGDWIELELSLGLAASGCEVCSCGVVPTSAVAALLPKSSYLAGAVISASHNPAEFNGIKFFTPEGKKIPDLWEREIERSLASGKFPAFDSACRPQTFPQAYRLYFEFLRKAVPPSLSLKGTRWVLDCANGAASRIAPEIFKSLEAEVISLHTNPDGKNINRECGAVHPRSLQEEVFKQKADGGCAFDGDADRVQFVDEKGRLMDGDILIALAAEGLQKSGELKNNCVVTTVMANLGFFQQMQKKGIRVITTGVGDRAVAEAMEANDSVLGGEQSGHIIFRQLLPTGDGLLTSVKIMEMVKKTGQPFSAFIDSFPKRPQLLVNLRVKNRIPIENLPAFKKAIEEAETQLQDRGRILVRYSGTEPLLRIMVQGNSAEEIKAVADSLLALAEKLLGRDERKQ